MRRFAQKSQGAGERAHPDRLGLPPGEKIGFLVDTERHIFGVYTAAGHPA